MAARAAIRIGSPPALAKTVFKISSKRALPTKSYSMHRSALRKVQVLTNSSNLTGNFYLAITGTEDRVWINRSGREAVIAEVIFADGTIWSSADLETRLTYAPRANITSASTGAVMNGTAGGDSLTGTAGPDEIDGAGTLLWRAIGDNLVTNASFEQLAVDAVAESFGYSAASLPGWTRINNNQAATTRGIEHVTSGHGGVNTTDGNYWLDLDGGGAGGSNIHVVQDIAGLTTGETLLLQFDRANRTSASSGAFEVLWNGAVVAAFNDTNRSMLTTRLLVTAAAGTNQLGFRGTGGQDGIGASLDNVRLTRGEAVASTIQGDDRLNGLDGDDIIRGAGGDDTIAGGLGNDRLEGRAGNDSPHWRFRRR